MEVSSPSKRVAAVGNYNGQQPVCDGVGVDGQWKHQRVRRGAQGRKPV